jgi:hypothetical protein
MGRGAKEVSPDAGEGPDPEAAARGEVVMVVVGASKVKGALPLRLPASEGNGTERHGRGLVAGGRGLPDVMSKGANVLVWICVSNVIGQYVTGSMMFASAGVQFIVARWSKMFYLL